MGTPPPCMSTLKFGSYDGNQMCSNPEMLKARQDIIEYLKNMLPAEYSDSKIEEFNIKLMSTANSMDEYKDLKTLDRRVQLLIDTNIETQPLRVWPVPAHRQLPSTAYSVPPPHPTPSTAYSVLPTPSTAYLGPPPPHPMQSPAYYVPTFNGTPIPHGTPSPAYSGIPSHPIQPHANSMASFNWTPTSHRMPSPQRTPSPAYSVPTFNGTPSPTCSVPPAHRMPVHAYSMPPLNGIPTPHGTPSPHRTPSPTNLWIPPNPMQSPVYSTPTSHETPLPAYSEPSILHDEMQYSYNTSEYDFSNNFTILEDAEFQHFPFSFEDAARDPNARTTTTTSEQTGICINSYGPICIPRVVQVAPLQNDVHTFRHQRQLISTGELHYNHQGILDHANAQNMIATSVLQTSLPTYDQQPCEYCRSHLFEFFRMRTEESFRNQHPKLCKKLDYLSKHLKRTCNRPSCDCSKYRLHYAHYIDAVKRHQVSRHQENTSSPPKRKKGAPRTSVRRVSHTRTGCQDQLPAGIDLPWANKFQLKKQHQAKRGKACDEAKGVHGPI